MTLIFSGIAPNSGAYCEGAKKKKKVRVQIGSAFY